ncbi:hypothetical protein BDN70DRAFT_936579 [Pholiota conissans]|uniref:Uncharacterized protein n=1 Tax=Pholiota conissans TaxID=109636 RepID=A0A9P5YSA9_9AGAR|nr:hypothetical protein BDN70DRAFT_936579 [Pholiota conissans]
MAPLSTRNGPKFPQLEVEEAQAKKKERVRIALAQARVRMRLKEERKKRPTTQWAKLEFHRYTDELLFIIEESPLPTGGQTVSDLYTEIADELFVQRENAAFTSTDPDELQKVASNRVARNPTENTVKKLGRMGQGLVEDREDEIMIGSLLANIWDSIKVKFP